MEIKKEDNDLVEWDNNNDSNPIYHNLDNKTRLDPEAAANTEKNNNKLKSEVNPKDEDEVVIAKYLSCCQIRSDISSQISVISSNRYEYFKCNPCT